MMAFVAIAQFGLFQDADAQSAKKTSLKDVVRENYGRKKDIPVDRIFSSSQKKINANFDSHLMLISFYDAKRQLNNCNEQDLSYIITADDAKYLAWNNLNGRYDTLGRGLEIWDKKNGYKGVFTYDAKNDIIDIHNAGMDMDNKPEFRFAMNAMFGKPLPATKVAIDYARQGFEDLQKNHPQIKKGKTALRFYGHSCGAPVAMTAAFGMALDGHKIEDIVLVDPYMVGKAYNSIRRSMMNRTERKKMDEFLNTVCTTLNPEGGSWLDKMNKFVPFYNVAKDIGTVKQIEITDERLRHSLPSYLEKITHN